ncbi:MAG: hypothetical protein ACRC9T_01875, partial [Vibrionaceae bacterium]
FTVCYCLLNAISFKGCGGHVALMAKLEVRLAKVFLPPANQEIFFSCFRVNKIYYKKPLHTLTLGCNFDKGKQCAHNANNERKQKIQISCFLYLFYSSFTRRGSPLSCKEKRKHEKKN